jgi:tRNA(Leu) C34 or U34 (ribose-2'-O)-methylase TrmL
MRVYEHVDFARVDITEKIPVEGWTPVCVEFDETAEMLPYFEHPERPFYIFGPEDGSVPKGIRHACHKFVKIPTASCLNLGAAINVVLYDWTAKKEFLW